MISPFATGYSWLSITCLTEVLFSASESVAAFCTWVLVCIALWEALWYAASPSVTVFWFFKFNHWPGVNITFKFGIYERVGGFGIIGGVSIISRIIGGMIAVSKLIWLFLESVDPASSSAVLGISATSLSSAIVASPSGASVIFFNVFWCCGRFLNIDWILSMNIGIFCSL